MENWSKPRSNTKPFDKTAQLAVRAKRIALLQQLQRITAMTVVHAPTLRKHPKGTQALIHMKAYLDAMHEQLAPGGKA